MVRWTIFDPTWQFGTSVRLHSLNMCWWQVVMFAPFVFHRPRLQWPLLEWWMAPFPFGIWENLTLFIRLVLDRGTWQTCFRLITNSSDDSTNLESRIRLFFNWQTEKKKASFGPIFKQFAFIRTNVLNNVTAAPFSVPFLQLAAEKNTDSSKGVLKLLYLKLTWWRV